MGTETPSSAAIAAIVAREVLGVLGALVVPVPVVPVPVIAPPSVVERLDPRRTRGEPARDDVVRRKFLLGK
ncbi:hypothetical protein [Actinotalea ferrariae]|uniref:hypothetical protein n=1 Tax=Actinotalea ferrariae TaxID=1386098 RepID=UPI0027E1FC9A|nr:hypothetical protein [Actinotalea ferrariae]